MRDNCLDGGAGNHFIDDESLPMKKVVSTGVWCSPEVYQYVSGLPVMKSLRAIVASVIRERVSRFGTQTVLSLGIGTGTIYKEILSDELRRGVLKVLGIDTSASMLKRCAEGAPVPVRMVDKLELCPGMSLILAQQNVLDDLGLDAECVDIVEAVLVLHHIARRDQLEDIVRRIRSVLRQDGLFVIGEIDLSLGAHIESKEQRLRAKYPIVERDHDAGVFVCRGATGEAELVPLLDKRIESDRQLIDYAISESLAGLQTEASLYGGPDSIRAIEIEVESVLKGAELNRSLEEWRDIVLSGFRQKGGEQVITTSDIRKQFPDVLDRPFVLILQKRSEPYELRSRSLHPPSLTAKPNLEEILLTKAELLCWGVRADENTRRFYEEQNPFHWVKTGNVGLNMILADLTPVLVSVTHRFNARSPYSLLKEEEWYICRNGRKLYPVTPIPMPQWYANLTSSGTSMPNVFLFEGYHYLHIVYQGCGFVLVGQGCKFCGTGGKWRRVSPRDIGEVVEAAYLEHPNCHVCLGGGTRLNRDKEVEYLTGCISEIRKRCTDVPVWVEMVPPPTDEHIRVMVDAGATSLGFNIELWDDGIRHRVCPGKSTVSKERYFQAFACVTELLGPNKVGSVLIAGLEPIGRTIEGIKALARAGVQPAILAFKPWNGSPLQSHPPADPQELIELSRVAARQMRLFNIAPSENEGCCNCHSCGIEDDFLELVFT